MNTLNIIGCGQLAKTLGYLFNKYQRYHIQNLYCRDFEKTLAAQKFIGKGEALLSQDTMKPADAYLLAVPDDQITTVSSQLAVKKIIRADDIVFHLSGALNSTVLSLLSEQGARVASAHPIKSFSDSSIDVANFAGIYCTLEGDKNACQILATEFRALGAHIMMINAEQKLLYHAATVMACNYQVCLIEIALKTFQSIGIDEVNALNLLQPLVNGLCARIFTSGTTQALTGPIVRGDSNLVKAEIQALKNFSPDIADVYQLLGKFALDITKNQSRLPDEVLKQLSDVLHDAHVE